MGVAEEDTMFGWNQADFNLATGDVGFEICEVHYYGSSSNPASFSSAQQWAAAAGKPLFWGELGYNLNYPLVRYTAGEDAIWANGGQAITSMVLTGTSGYPYTGGTLNYPDVTIGSTGSSGSATTLGITSTPVTSASVGVAYSYTPAATETCTYKMTSNATFLNIGGTTGTVSGTPTSAGKYNVEIVGVASNGGDVYQNYTLTVKAASTVSGTTGASGTTGGSGSTGPGTSATNVSSSNGSSGLHWPGWHGVTQDLGRAWSGFSSGLSGIFGGIGNSWSGTVSSFQSAGSSGSSGGALLIVLLAACVVCIAGYAMTKKR